MKAILGLSPDITTKAHGTRKRFTRKLTSNLERALKAEGIRGSVRWTMARLHLESDDPRAIAVAQRVFGIHSVMPARHVALGSLDDLIRTGHEWMAPRVEGRTFAVRARVRDPSAWFGSQNVNEALGAALVPHGRVQLDDPEVTVHVEVRDGRVWFFTDVVPGEGGLPVGTGGRALLLMSGGFDSAVAGWRMLRRGVALDLLCFRLGGDAHERAAIAASNHLAQRWYPGIRSRLWLVPFEEAVERMRREVQPRFWQLVLKRMMYQTAEAVAARTRAEALVTGEAIGQVSTQTLPNLRALDASVALPVLRPLLTEDKVAILKQARHVGTHDMSARVPEYCALDAKKPATAATATRLAEAAAPLGFQPTEILRDAAWVDLPTGGSADEDLELGRPPTGARILDLRSATARRRDPMDAAEPVEPLDILDRPETLDSGTDYVVICDVGARSAWFARELRKLGFRAWTLRAAG